MSQTPSPPQAASFYGQRRSPPPFHQHHQQPLPQSSPPNPAAGAANPSAAAAAGPSVSRGLRCFNGAERRDSEEYNDRKSMIYSNIFGFVSVRVTLLLGLSVAIVAVSKKEKYCIVSMVALLFACLNTLLLLYWFYDLISIRSQEAENVERKRELLSVWREIKSQGFEDSEIDSWFNNEEPDPLPFGFLALVTLIHVITLIFVAVIVISGCEV